MTSQKISMFYREKTPCSYKKYVLIKDVNEKQCATFSLNIKRKTY